MSEQHPTAIPAGSPIWIDYSAADFATQQDFYAALFGWRFEDTGEDFGHYRMIHAGEATIGGAMDAELTAQFTGAPVQPAAWSVYLKTDDMAATLDAARANGGTVVVEPMDVGALGAMAFVLSPGGEAVGFWEPHDFAGHDLPLTPGTSVWFEVMSTDFRASADFYRAVAGWDVVPMGEDGQGADGPAADDEAMPAYATNHAGERATAGLCDTAPWLPEGTPSYWRVYFQTADMDEAVRTIEAKGGRVTDGPMDSPFGIVATVLDPAGATFQLNQPHARG